MEPNESYKFKEGGFYSSPLVYKNGAINAKAKIISFNSNYCYTMNSAQLSQFRDPSNMMAWLE